MCKKLGNQGGFMHLPPILGGFYKKHSIIINSFALQASDFRHSTDRSSQMTLPPWHASQRGTRVSTGRSPWILSTGVCRAPPSKRQQDKVDVGWPIDSGPVSIQGLDIERMMSSIWVSTYTTILDWSDKTDCFYKKGHYHLHQFAPVDVWGPLLRTFFDTVVASGLSGTRKDLTDWQTELVQSVVAPLGFIEREEEGVLSKPPATLCITRRGPKTAPLATGSYTLNVRRSLRRSFIPPAVRLYSATL